MSAGPSPEERRPRCESRFSPPSYAGSSRRCQLDAGHEGRHTSSKVVWDDADASLTHWQRLGVEGGERERRLIVGWLRSRGLDGTADDIEAGAHCEGVG